MTYAVDILHPPCEIMVDDFLPNMRAIVAYELHEEGQSQRRIGSFLGITQARVSHYLSKRKSFYYEKLTRSFGISEGELEGFAKILSEDASRSQVEGIFSLYSIWKNLLFQGRICSLHQKASSIPQDCSVCMELHKPQAETPTGRPASDYSLLRDMSEAISLIERSPLFPAIMPEVSVNIAACRKRPDSKREIAAIPGRINRIHGRAKAFAQPEFGSSNHMSNVLIIFNGKSEHIKSVMNLTCDESIEKCIFLNKVPKFTTKAQDTKSKKTAVPVLTPEQRVLKRLAEVRIPASWSKKLPSPFAVVDLGSEGLEPITYLFGSDPLEVAQLALKLALTYSMNPESDLVLSKEGALMF